MKVFVFALFLALAAAKDYNGYTVLKTAPLSDENAKLLRELQLANVDLDFWSEAQPGLPAQIMASPGQSDNLKALFALQGIDFTTKLEDVGATIAETSPKGRSSRFDFNDYYGYDEIVSYIEDLAAGDSDVNVVSIGESFEGRDTKIVSITRAGDGAPNVWIEAGIHAREWIAPAVALFTINELINESDLTSKLNFHILPVANPDGYEYTFSDDRLWRKTRSDLQGSQCKGADPNRNFDWHFGESGVSNNKCSDTYPGPEPFSEIECRNIRDFVSSLSPKPVVAKAVHSAAELFLYPYGWAVATYPDNVDEIRELGDAAVEALNAVHGMNFVNQHSAGLYPAAGDANDWYTGFIEARFTYTVELRDQGYGFLLPAEQIIPSGEEMWAAYKVIFQKAIDVSY